MTRLLPYPVASASLMLLWLLLTQSLSLAHILAGLVVGLVGGWWLRRLEASRAEPRRFGAICRLAALVIADIVRSNIAVARLILGLERRTWTSGFVEIPLKTRNRYALAMLACIITATPGTLWADFEQATGILTIHVVDLVEETLWIRTIQERYERLLLEIFP